MTTRVTGLATKAINYLTKQRYLTNDCTKLPKSALAQKARWANNNSQRLYTSQKCNFLPNDCTSLPIFDLTSKLRWTAASVAATLLIFDQTTKLQCIAAYGFFQGGLRHTIQLFLQIFEKK